MIKIESLADLEFAKQKRAKRDKENTIERHKENTKFHEKI